jgi:hypothetical protein
MILALTGVITMKKLALAFITFAVIASSCATKGPNPADDVLSFRLIKTAEVTGKFDAEGAPSPFTQSFLRFTTAPNHFMTAFLHVPKNVGRVEIESLVVVTKDGSLRVEAMDKKGMFDYWEGMPSEASNRRKQTDAIERFYLPANMLEGKKLGHNYVVVFISAAPYESTDRVGGKFLVDGEEKTFELDPSTFLKDWGKY